MKKIIISVFTLFIAFTVSAQHDHSAASADTLKKSIPREVHAQVGAAHLMLHYHAPAVRGRMIWGGLVPYGEVWVTGAHSATSWEFNKDIVIGNTTIAAGKYAVFTIPGKEKWTVIINRNWNQHLTDDYNVKDDVARIDITPQTTVALQERLQYSITSLSNSNGVLSIRWEKLKLDIPFLVR
jgi:hypothetical protein